MISKEGLRVLDSILIDIPTNHLTGEYDQEIRIGDLTINKKSNWDIDREVATFLIKYKLADFILGSNPLAGNRESRTLRLTNSGKRLCKKGSYAAFISLPLLVILKVFKVDLYCWWVSLSSFWKDVIKVGGWAIIAAGLIEVFKAVYQSVDKHSY